VVISRLHAPALRRAAGAGRFAKYIIVTMIQTLFAGAMLASVATATVCDSFETCSAAIADAQTRLPRGVSTLLSAATSALSHLGSITASPSKDETYCANASAFDLVPLTVSNFSANAAGSSWSGDGCFSRVTAAATWPAGGGVQVTLTGEGAANIFCGDAYILANSFSLSLPVEISAIAPSATLTLPAWAADSPESVDVALNGITIGLLPCGSIGTLTSLLNTVNIFSPLSGRIEDLVTSNAEFLNSRAVWSGPNGSGSPLEPFGRQTDVNPLDIHSGDYLTILRFDVSQEDG
jgi:hypothetical protein